MRREHVAAGLGLLALALVLFRHAVFGGGTLFLRDVNMVWLPQVETLARALASGSWPLWDPHRGFGQPLLADPRAEVLYPPAWPGLLLPPWAAYSSFVVAHLVFSGLGLYALLRRWRAAPLPSFAGAAAWLASGPLLSLAPMWHHLAGAAWLPWIFLAGERARESGGARRLLPLALGVAAQVFAGSPDFTALTLLALCAWLLADRFDRHALLGVAGGVGLGLVISAAQWIPTLDVARRSERWSQPGSAATTWSLHPLATLEAALPFRWSDLRLEPGLAAAIFEGREPWLGSIYLGVGTLVLAGAALAGLTRRKRVLVALAVAFLLVSWGHHSVAYDLGVRLLPPLRLLRFPVKAFVVSAFCVSLLAGLGLDALRRGSAARWLAAAFVILDLARAHAGLNPTAPRELFTFRPEALDVVRRVERPRVYVYDYSMRVAPPRATRPGPESYRLARVPSGWPPAAGLVLGVHEYLNPPTAGRWGLDGSYDADILGFYPVPLVRTVELLRETEGWPAHLRLLQMGAVSHALSLREDVWWRGLEPVATLPGLFADPIHVLAVPDRLPRAYVVAGARIVDGRRALETLVAPDFDPRREVVLAAGAARPAGPAPGEARLIERRADRVTLEASLDAPGFLVLLEAYDPGWRAFVDGREQEVLRANMAFRAVALTAGRHRLEFRYRPRAVYAGLAVSLAGAAAALVLARRGVGA